jgi:hypothetical protein
VKEKSLRQREEGEEGEKEQDYRGIPSSEIA